MYQGIYRDKGCAINIICVKTFLKYEKNEGYRVSTVLLVNSRGFTIDSFKRKRRGKCCFLRSDKITVVTASRRALSGRDGKLMFPAAPTLISVLKVHPNLPLPEPPSILITGLQDGWPGRLRPARSAEQNAGAACEPRGRGGSSFAVANQQTRVVARTSELWCSHFG